MDTRLVRKRSTDKTDSDCHEPRAMPWGYSAGKRSSSTAHIDTTCSAASCCIGALFIVLGATLIWWADLDRMQKEQQDAVRKEVVTWEQKHRELWQSTKWELLVNGTEVGELLISEQIAVLEENPLLTVTSSRRTRLKVLGTVFPFANITIVDGEKSQFITEEMQHKVTIEAQASSPAGVQQRLELYHGPLVWSKAKSANSWKGCHFADKGFWNAVSRQCIYWQYLSNLCMKLELSPETGLWSLSKHYGDFGCNVLQQFEPLGVKRLPVRNWRVDTPPRITMEQDAKQETKCSDADIAMHRESEYDLAKRVITYSIQLVKQVYKSTVSIFEAHDPYLFVANMTHGVMVLAEDSINEAALGITSGIFGFVLMVPFVLLKMIAMFEAKVKKDEPSLDEIPFYACEVDEH